MAETITATFDMDGPPYQLVFTDEQLVIKDAIPVAPGETTIVSPIAEEDLGDLVVHQTITTEATLTVGATQYRLYNNAGTWTIVEL
jgi:hypothetical protein